MVGGVTTVELGLAVLGHVLQVLVRGGEWNCHDLVTGLVCLLVSPPALGPRSSSRSCRRASQRRTRARRRPVAGLRDACGPGRPPWDM